MRESLDDPPLYVVMGDQLCSIKIEVTCKFATIEHNSSEYALPNKLDTSFSTVEGKAPTVGKVGAFDRPLCGVTLHPIGAQRSYTWKRIDLHQETSGQKNIDKSRFSTSMERRQIGASGQMGKAKEPQMIFKDQ